MPPVRVAFTLNLSTFISYSCFKMKRPIILTWLFLMIFPLAGISQVNSIASGNWSEETTWDCNCVPDIGQGIITIKPTHHVIVSDEINVQELVINPDGILTIDNGSRLIVLSNLTQQPANPPISINNGKVITNTGGVLENRGVITSIAASMIFQTGSEYQHNQTNGLIPVATWQSGSTCRVTGWSVDANADDQFKGSLNQIFHNFIWDCPGQKRANVQLQGSLTTINGNLVISNTSSGNRQLSLGGNNTAISILGDLIVENEGRVNLAVSAGGSYSIHVGGNCIFSSINENTNHYTIGGSGVAGITNLNVAGNMTLTSGQLNLATAAGTGNINIGGNLFLTGGTIIKQGTGTGTVSFISSTSHNLNKVSGTFAGGNLVVQTGSTLNFTGNPMFMAGNVTVQSGATLNMPPAISTSGDLQFVSGSTINSNAGTITLTGSTLTQTINANGATLHNITIDKSIDAVNINLTSPLALTGALTIVSTGAGTVVNSNGNLTLLSTSDANTGNASIGPLLNGANVLGDVTVQRFMSPEGRIYRYISSPITNAPISQLQDDFPVTGPFPQSSICTGCSTNPSLFYYNALTKQYVNYPTASNAEQLIPGTGYSAFIRQDVVPMPLAGITLDLTGLINKGDVSLPVSHNSSGDSWNLVGNPYPASIDWDDASWTKTNISTSIAVKDNGDNGNFRYWDGTPGGDIVDGVIAAGQGFWVRTDASSPQLIVRENAKALSTGAFFREKGVNVMSLTLNKGELYDKAYFKIREGAELGLDTYDAPKLVNDNFDFSTRFSDTVPMAINAVGQIPCGTELFLDLRFTRKSSGEFVIDPLGNYSLSLEVSGSEFARYSITFLDTFTGNQFLVTSGASYTFQVTADPASMSSSRFKLIFEGIPPNLNLKVAGEETVCGGSIAHVFIEDSDPKFDYQLMLDDKVLSTEKSGTGTALALPVPGSLLPSGNNVLKVRVNGVCGIDYLEENWVINRYPDAVISVEKGEVLVSNYDSGNQWYYNNELIPGAIEKTYKPSESGIYGLVVAHETCSSITEIKFSITGLEDVQEFMSVFPNPFRNSIHIKGLSPDTSEERAIIINSMGQLMGQFEIKYDPINNSGYLNLDELADGFYIIKIKSKDTYLSYPIIKDSKI